MAQTEPRFITPPNILKQKVGNDGIPEAILNKCQNYINNNDLDITPIAKDFLKELEEAIKNARKSSDSHEETLETMIQPMMQLKGNCGMFRYQLVSDVADIGLQFLEAVEELNDDVLDVVGANAQTIKIIIKNKLTGDGGKEGYSLVQELHKASQRYFTKHKPQPKKKQKKK